MVALTSSLLVVGCARVGYGGSGTLKSQPKIATVGSSKPGYTVLLIGAQPEKELEASYTALGSNKDVAAAVRTVDQDPDSSSTVTWDAKRMNYYYTAASSDFAVYEGKPLYVTPEFVTQILTRTSDRGLYLHEVVAYGASGNNWDWAAAAARVNWPLLNTWVMQAKAAGKSVIWSEPAQGWQAINSSALATSYLKRWGSTLVPMFGTNFTNPTNLVPIARSGAVATASEYGESLGESVQSWYWNDRDRTFTSAAVLQLCRYGASAGASVFQFEGNGAALTPGSSYLQGVLQFTASLTATASALTDTTSAQLP